VRGPRGVYFHQKRQEVDQYRVLKRSSSVGSMLMAPELYNNPFHSYFSPLLFYFLSGTISSLIFFFYKRWFISKEGNELLDNLSPTVLRKIVLIGDVGVLFAKACEMWRSRPPSRYLGVIIFLIADF
jgi:asparagine N-glycosylation enzyme membrane subunit Stt3